MAKTWAIVRRELVASNEENEHLRRRAACTELAVAERTHQAAAPAQHPAVQCEAESVELSTGSARKARRGGHTQTGQARRER